MSYRLPLNKACANWYTDAYSHTKKLFSHDIHSSRSSTSTMLSLVGHPKRLRAGLATREEEAEEEAEEGAAVADEATEVPLLARERRLRPVAAKQKEAGATAAAQEEADEAAAEVGEVEVSIKARGAIPTLLGRGDMIKRWPRWALGRECIDGAGL